MYSVAAEQLILGTIAVESDMGSNLVQMGGGPALGICQIEPATAQDLLYRYLARREDIDLRFQRAFQVVNDIDLQWGQIDIEKIKLKLISDLRFQVGLCRLRYWVVPAPLPQPGDVLALAQYWKSYYNTSGGQGSVAKFARKHAVYGLDRLPT